MKKTGGIFHDRFIVLDYGTDDERVFLCGASSKDVGARITSIVEDYGISKYASVIAMLLKNPTLILPQQRGVNVLKKKTKCYIYTRVSTAIQVDGYSLDAQKDKLKKYAEFQDIYCHAGGREHEAILSVEDWKTAQKIRKRTGVKRIKTIN